MERVPVESRWVNERWQVSAAVPEPAGTAAGAERVSDDAGREWWFWHGFELELHRSEGEGYWLNVTSPEPRVFVRWRQDEDRAVPQYVTVSYNEAARWLDGGEQVDGVPMAAPIHAWLVPWVAENYRPEPRRKVRRNDPFKDGAFRRDRE
jgi:hypothetical protein